MVWKPSRNPPLLWVPSFVRSLPLRLINRLKVNVNQFIDFNEQREVGKNSFWKKVKIKVSLWGLDVIKPIRLRWWTTLVGLCFIKKELTLFFIQRDSNSDSWYSSLQPQPINHHNSSQPILLIQMNLPSAGHLLAARLQFYNIRPWLADHALPLLHRNHLTKDNFLTSVFTQIGLQQPGPGFVLDPWSIMELKTLTWPLRLGSDFTQLDWKTRYR